MKRVLVTGANGHVGNNLCRLLLEHGYEVRASVRDPRDPAKTAPLAGLDVSLVQADLMQPETLVPAMADVDGVFQVAAVYSFTAKNPQREIIDPSIVGGINVLRAAHEAGIKRVVFTSSTAAVGTNGTPEHPLTEEDWNDSAKSPYLLAKNEAERRAWTYAEETGLDLVVINPGGIIGPRFYHHTPTTQFIELALRGKLPAVPPMALSFVDVRDVAEAHRLAYENQDARGRYITVDRNFSLMDLLRELSRHYPECKPPRFELRKTMLWPIAGIDWLVNKLTGRPRQLTVGLIRDTARKQQVFSTDKIRRELGWQPMPLEQCLRDTADWVRSHFIDKYSSK